MYVVTSSQMRTPLGSTHHT